MNSLIKLFGVVSVVGILTFGCSPANNTVEKAEQPQLEDEELLSKLILHQYGKQMTHWKSVKDEVEEGN
ncbi:MAG: hypothetical protein RJQ09_21140 [Cyclobacteriaceae bacterium]